MGKVFGSCQTGGGLWLRLLPGRGGWRRWGALWDWVQDWDVEPNKNSRSVLKTQETNQRIFCTVINFRATLLLNFTWISLHPTIIFTNMGLLHFRNKFHCILPAHQISPLWEGGGWWQTRRRVCRPWLGDSHWISKLGYWHKLWIDQSLQLN